MTREEAINIIKSECYVFNPLNLDRSTMINTALDMAIISLEQEPKIGHWYRKHSWEICFTCSNCETTNASGTKYNYCPSCGARMAEREEA